MSLVCNRYTFPQFYDANIESVFELCKFLSNIFLYNKNIIYLHSKLKFFKMKIDLKNTDCLEFLKNIPDNSIDFVCIDPPYGILTGHKIETVLDIPMLMQEFYRVSKQNAFFAFFGMMPTIIDWYLEAKNAGFSFSQDVIWCKRDGSGNGKFNRIHEIIYIMKKGSPKYAETKMSWEDVSQPMVYDGIMNIESIYRELSYWKSKAQGRNPSNMKKTQGKSNDDFHGKAFAKLTEKQKPSFGQEEVRISTIWSFLPHNKANKNPLTGQIRHPTVKSIDVLQRLVKLCTQEQDIVLDCFSGSGTTAIACVLENRNFIGCELDNTFFEESLERIEKYKTQQKFFY